MDYITEEIGRVMGSQIYIYNSPDEIPALPPKGVNDVFIDINLGKVYQWDGTEWKYKFPIPNDSRIVDIVAELTALGASLTDDESQRVLAEQGRVTAEEARQLAESQRESSETARQSAEGNRQTAESGRETAEGNRNLSEQSRETAEGQRVVAEGQRATAEGNRASAESARALAEEARATAESGRVSADSARAGAESARATAEGQRSTAETARANAESARASAETSRQTNESTRQSQEQTRQSQESARQTAEGNRATAEQTRAQNEVARQLAESNRADAEGLRVQAENTRAANDTLWNGHEQTRQANEDQRVLAEQARVEAEVGRQAELDSKITYGSRWFDGTGGVGHADVAEQIDSEVGVTKEMITSFDTTGGGTTFESGGQKALKLTGVDVVRNQIRKARITYSAEISIATASNGKLRVTGTSRSVGTFAVLLSYVKTVAGHRYLIYFENTEASHYYRIYLYTSGGSFDSIQVNQITSTMITTVGSSKGGLEFRLAIKKTASEVYDDTIDLRIIDLTKRYGNNDVVNAIIGSDSSKYVENLLAFDPEILADTSYDAGSFPTVKSKYLKTVGFNLYNPSTGKAELKGGHETRIIGAYTSLTFDAIDGTSTTITPDEDGGFTPSMDGTLTVTGGNSATTCVFIHYDDDRVEFEPYEEHVYKLPNQQLHGVLKVASGKVVADGDELYPDGTGKQNYGVYTFTGNENWIVTDSKYWRIKVEDMPDGLKGIKNLTTDILIPGYHYATFNDIYGQRDETGLGYSSSVGFYCGGYVSGAGPKTALVGKTIVFKLATPTPLTAPAYPENVYMDDFGTMGFLDEDSHRIPGLQGIEVGYLPNLRGFLEDVYDLTAGDSDELVTEDELATKADKEALENGTFVVNKAKVAEQVENVSDESGSTQTKPFLFQATGTDDNTTETPTAPVVKHLELRGNSVLWNQKARPLSSSYWSNEDGLRTFDATNNATTYTATGDETENYFRLLAKDDDDCKIQLANGHKYLLIVNVTAFSTSLAYTDFEVYSSSSGLSGNFSASVGVKGLIMTATSNSKVRLGIVLNVTSGTITEGDVCTFKDLMLIDLTLMGKASTYTTVAKFRKDFPLPYYICDKGSIRDCASKYLETVGYNQFAGLDTDIPAIPSTIYRLMRWNGSALAAITSGSVKEYDAAGNLLRTTAYNGLVAIDTLDQEYPNQTDKGFMTTADTSSIQISGATQTNILLNIAWDGSRNEYEAYWRMRYPMPNVTLRSVKSTRDSITSDGTLTRRVGVVDLGTLNWDSQLAYGQREFFCKPANRLTDAVLPSNVNQVAYIVCGRYDTVARTAQVKYGVALDTNGTIIVKTDQYGYDAAAFKSAMMGVYVYYQLATPTTEQGAPFTENVEVDDFGTMRFVPVDGATEPIAKQGNRFFYPADYVLLIDDLNNYVNGDVAELAKKAYVDSELGAVDDKHDAIYDIVKENLGGILRHQLASSQSLDFDDTKAVDAGTLAWEASSTYGGAFHVDIADMEEGVSGEMSKVLLPVYKSVNANYVSVVYDSVDKQIFVQPLSNRLLVIDKSKAEYTAAQFAASLSGVMLAYKKASS